jgi:hypothetical protein
MFSDPADIMYFPLIARLFSSNLFLIGYYNLGYIFLPDAATPITGIDPVFPLSGIGLLKNLNSLGGRRIPLVISALRAGHNCPNYAHIPDS